MDLLLHATKWFFIAGGCFFLLVGAIGVLRFPDLFTRFHAASLTDTLGAGMLLIGFMFEAGFSQVTIKLIIILLFLFLTSPTSSHALAKAALHGGQKPIPSNDKSKLSTDLKSNTITKK